MRTTRIRESVKSNVKCIRLNHILMCFTCDHGIVFCQLSLAVFLKVILGLWDESRCLPCCDTRIGRRIIGGPGVRAAIALKKASSITYLGLFWFQMIFLLIQFILSFFIFEVCNFYTFRSNIYIRFQLIELRLPSC